MDSAIFSAAAAAGLMVRVTSAPDVEVSDRTVHLEQVATVAGPGATAARGVVVAGLAGGSTVGEISRADLARLIRRAVPAATVVGDLSGRIRIHSPAAAGPFPAAAYADDRRVARGDKLTLSATVGPVTVRRKVVAVQDATSRHKRVFVRSSDGEVFAAPIGAEQ